MDGYGYGEANGMAPHYEQSQCIEPSMLLQPQHQQPPPPQPLAPSQPAEEAQNGRDRPITLNEALPYTPFTSVFPFEPAIIHNPTIGSGQLAPSVAGLVSHEDYDALNQEAEAPTQSKRLDGSLEFIQSLLKPEKITLLTRLIPDLSQFKTAPKTTASTDGTSKSLADGLSPFARMIYNNSAVNFRYPTPDTPRQTPTPHGQTMSPRTGKKSPKVRKSETHKVVKHNPATTNAQAVAKNHARIEVHIPTQRELEAAGRSISATPQPPPQSQSTPQAREALQPSPFSHPATVSPADLMVRPQSQPQSQSQPRLTPKSERPSPTATSTTPTAQVKSEHSPQPMVSVTPAAAPAQDPQKISPHVGISIELPAATFNRAEFVVVDDSADAPAYLSKKRKRVELEDNENLQNGALGNRELANNALKALQRCLREVFEAEDKLESGHNTWVTMVDQQATLTIAAFDRVQKCLLKTQDLNCFRLVPVEELQRLQSLCDGALRHAEGLDCKIDESWGRLMLETAFTVMCGAREEKQLYSEDLIQLGLDLFKNVMEGIIIPIVEMRATSEAKNGIFKHLLAHKKPISTIFTACQKLFALLSNLNSSIDLSETVVGTLEFTSTRLIFVENAFTEKDSIVGVQKFDGLRLVAMDLLSQIFVLKPASRQGIFDDILTSLEKLPKSKSHAKQFKLSEGGSIQPVSALIMRLVQASAAKVAKSKGANSLNEDGDEGQSTHRGDSDTNFAVRSEEMASTEAKTAVGELEALTKPLSETAMRNASYVIQFMVNRALRVAKTGEQNTPRVLLDLFIEDFTKCLGMPDWPAAELILRMAMFMMLEIIKSDKHTAPAKNMALEILGAMAAAISDLRSDVRKAASSFEGSDADAQGRFLADLSFFALDRKHSPEKITGWSGPYRVVSEYLEGCLKQDPHLTSAISFMVMDWSVGLCNTYEGEVDEEDSEREAEYGRMAYRLRKMTENRQWLTAEYSYAAAVSANHAKLAYSIILLRSNFCDSYKGILSILMQSMTTDAATVRSKSLKSITSVLETDPAILDGDSVVVDLILQCSNDTSPQVRDSALGLIGKCIGMRPHLEQRMIPTINQRFNDSSLAVRKRSMKLARDIYLRNKDREIRCKIANGLLLRIQDPDDSVKELARQMIEEVWIAPFYKADESTAYRQALTDHVALMVQTVRQGNSSQVLDKAFQIILSQDTKLVNANTQVCTRLVANMFDLVDNPDSDDPSVPSGKGALQILMVFAKAEPKLFTFEQIRRLQPRIASISTSEDLSTSRAVAVIYRRILPQVPRVHTQFLADVRKELMPCVSKVTRVLLDDVVACLWIISGLLENTAHLSKLVISSMLGVQNIRALSLQKPLDQQRFRQFDRYALIVGMIGKHCDLDSQVDMFKEKFKKWKGGPVSKLMVDVLAPFAAPDQATEMRKPALDAIGLICQSNPQNFLSVNVYTIFQQVFEERVPALESMILRSFKEFLFTEEKRSEEAAAAGAAGKDEPDQKDLKVMASTSFDAVAMGTTHRFLKDITRITLASQDDHAFLATEILSSISRQGLVHPKETGVTLITLETCPRPDIAKLAYVEHKSLHQKHEKVLEKEYAKAVQSAFHYQRDIVKDARGATANPFTSKLQSTLSILNDNSNTKGRQRFIDKFVGLLDFDMSKLEDDSGCLEHVESSRFLVENLAFFDYAAMGDIQATVSAMEKIVHMTGSGIAQAIESDVFQVRVDTALASEVPVENGDQPVIAKEPDIDPKRLRQLTAGAMILLSVWEARTYLRKLYNLNKKTEAKAKLDKKAAAKDVTKTPVKVQGVTGDKFWEDMATIMTGLDSRERMIETCKNFNELMNVDSEVRIGEEDDELDADGEPTTPNFADDDDDEENMDGRGRKRKAGDTPGGRKKRARSNSKPRKRGRPRKNPLPVADDEPEMEDEEMNWAY
ncbi:AT hook domain-containing protein [Apiospora rasikravindrae]|uniref:Sister chromatid cohesion protein n=1 Tax=Apiospora rasikravindrae TaxID=990691 RepID=A0ABR1TZV0_9PEZI